MVARGKTASPRPQARPAEAPTPGPPRERMRALTPTRSRRCAAASRPARIGAAAGAGEAGATIVTTARTTRDPDRPTTATMTTRDTDADGRAVTSGTPTSSRRRTRAGRARARTPPDRAATRPVQTSASPRQGYGPGAGGDIASDEASRSDSLPARAGRTPCGRGGHRSRPRQAARSLGDALSTAAEDVTGNDPVDRDTDGDGVRDGAGRAGTVTALKNGELTIRLARGGVLRGFVDNSTAVGCSSERRLERGHASRGHKTRRHGRTAIARSSQAPTDEEPLDEEPIEDEDPFAGDESDDPFEDEFLEDEEAEDDELDDDFEDAAAVHSCGLSSLRRGARVHQAKVELTADGLFFTQIQLLS